MAICKIELPENNARILLLSFNKNKSTFFTLYCCNYEMAKDSSCHNIYLLTKL